MEGWSIEKRDELSIIHEFTGVEAREIVDSCGSATGLVCLHLRNYASDGTLHPIISLPHLRFTQARAALGGCQHICPILSISPPFRGDLHATAA